MPEYIASWMGCFLVRVRTGEPFFIFQRAIKPPNGLLIHKQKARIAASLYLLVGRRGLEPRTKGL